MYSKHLGLSKKPWGFRSHIEGSTSGFWSPSFLEEAPKFPASFLSFFRRRFDVWFFWLLIHVRPGYLLKGSTPILRVLFSFDVSGIFGGGSKVVSKFSSRSRVSWLDSHSTYLGISALVSGTWYNWVSPLCYCHWVFNLPIDRLAALLVGSWSQSSPWFSGFSEVLGRTASRLLATSQEFCFLHSVVLVLIQRRFIQDYYFLSNGLLSVAVFPRVLRGGEGK